MFLLEMFIFKHCYYLGSMEAKDIKQHEIGSKYYSLNISVENDTNGFTLPAEILDSTLIREYPSQAHAGEESIVEEPISAIMSEVNGVPIYKKLLC